MGNLHATSSGWCRREKEEVSEVECSAEQCRKQKVLDLECGTLGQEMSR